MGPAITGFEVRDVVASMYSFGDYAIHIILPVADAIKLQADYDLIKAAALLPNYMTAYGMLNWSKAKVEPGSSVLIRPASGGIGTAMAQLVKAFDLDITMYVLCSPTKFGHVKALGVTPIDRHAPNVPVPVRELNDGKGVDVSFDAAGSKESLDSSLEAGGQVVAIGGMSLIPPDGSGMVNAGSFDLCADIAQNPNMCFFGVATHYYQESETCSTATSTTSSKNYVATSWIR